MFGDIATDQKLPTFLKMHEAAFAYLGGIPETILYDNCNTVVIDYDDRGEPIWQETFRDFAAYWGFVPRLCRPYRAQTKGKVENGIGCLRKNFLCGRTALSVADLSHQLAVWTATVANVRIHGTTTRRWTPPGSPRNPRFRPCSADPRIRWSTRSPAWSQGTPTWPSVQTAARFPGARPANA